MATVLKWIFLVPVAIVVVVFAIANRHIVTVVFDPFSTDTPAIALSGPLFLVLLVTLALGVLIGGIATWITQARFRRAARRARDEARRLHVELERQRLERRAAEPALPGLPGVTVRSTAA